MAKVVFGNHGAVIVPRDARDDIYPERIVEGYSRAVLNLEAVNGATKFTVTHSVDRSDSKLIAAASGSWPLSFPTSSRFLKPATPPWNKY